MKVIKITDKDFEVLERAFAHAECWMLHISQTNTDARLREWAQEMTKEYLEVSWNIEINQSTGD